MTFDHWSPGQNVRAAYRLETPVGPDSFTDTLLLCHFRNSEAIEQRIETVADLHSRDALIESHCIDVAAGHFVQ